MEKYRFITVVMALVCLMLFIVLYENQPVYEVSTVTHTKKIAITFDDGPHYERTALLLDGLKKRGVKATFFLVGNRIEGCEDLVLRMKNEGHLIGNHSYSHTDLTKINEMTLLSEVNETNRIIEEITGEEVLFIRPPCGFWDEKLTQKINMTPVFWDVDPLDWCTVNAGVVVDRVINDVEDGDIILFHDIYLSSVTAALEVIDQLIDRGYVFVTVDELLEE